MSSTIFSPTLITHFYYCNVIIESVGGILIYFLQTAAQAIYVFKKQKQKQNPYNSK